MTTVTGAEVKYKYRVAKSKLEKYVGGELVDELLRLPSFTESALKMDERVLGVPNRNVSYLTQIFSVLNAMAMKTKFVARRETERAYPRRSRRGTTSAPFVRLSIVLTPGTRSAL
jgi:hypothetical protein